MRIGLLVSLLVVAASACADWVRVARTDAAVHYVDPSTVQKDGTLRTVWALQDMAHESPGGVMSIRALQEYDCADGRSRYLSLASYSRPMAGGEVLAEHALRDRWTPKLRNAKASTIANIVCGP